jgi:hypothetical protein
LTAVWSREAVKLFDIAGGGTVKLSKGICNFELNFDYGIGKKMTRAKAQSTPSFFKSPFFPLCQRGMKGGFLDFFALLASLREKLSCCRSVEHLHR